MTRTEIFSKLVERNEERFEIAQGLAVAVITDCNTDISLKFRALSLLAHYSMDGISPVMEEEFGYMWLRKRKLFVDCEHALAAQSILAESGHVFTKMKRAERVATGGLVQWPNNTQVLKLESTKNIGDLPELLENGGRANKIDSALSSHLLGQAFMVKCGDVFF